MVRAALASSSGTHVRRRDVLKLLVGTAAEPLAADAQQRTPVIGYLGSGSSELFAGRLNAFRQGLGTTGDDA